MGTIHWINLAEVQPKPVQWLWNGRVPFGKVTLLDGEPGSGKSLVALELAARVSRGAAMPLARHKPSGPANVVIYNDDDNLADTVRPRLEAAGADLTHIRCVDGEFAAADVAELRPALIIVDPLSTYLCRENEVPPRHFIKNVTLLAKETGAAVLAVQFIPRTGFWANEICDAARSILHISSIGHGRYRLTVTKSNLVSVSDVPPLVYHLDSTDDAVKVSGWADSV